MGDFLNGGRGDDRILIGRADRASGGPGADGFVLGGWLSGAGGMATIDDYDPASDTLYLMCDPDLTRRSPPRPWGSRRARRGDADLP